MKTKHILFILALTLFSVATRAQIIVQTVSLSVICCADSDSIDIGNNGQYDLKIKSMFEGTDSYDFNMKPLQNNIQVQNNPVAFGVAFSESYYSTGLIAQTLMLCQWSNMYAPGSGYKYQGFRRINAPADTTFGWIKLNFVGDYSCKDTVYISELAYSASPNIHLLAGEKPVSTSLKDLNMENRLSVFPNPASDLLFIHNLTSTTNASYEIYNELGKLVVNGNVVNKAISTRALSNGLYFIRISTDTGSSFSKFVKE